MSFWILILFEFWITNWGIFIAITFNWLNRLELGIFNYFQPLAVHPKNVLVCVQMTQPWKYQGGHFDPIGVFQFSLKPDGIFQKNFGDHSEAPICDVLIVEPLSGVNLIYLAAQVIDMGGTQRHQEIWLWNPLFFLLNFSHFYHLSVIFVFVCLILL